MKQFFVIVFFLGGFFSHLSSAFSENTNMPDITKIKENIQKNGDYYIYSSSVKKSCYPLVKTKKVRCFFPMKNQIVLGHGDYFINEGSVFRFPAHNFGLLDKYLTEKKAEYFDAKTKLAEAEILLKKFKMDIKSIKKAISKLKKAYAAAARDPDGKSTMPNYFNSRKRLATIKKDNKKSFNQQKKVVRKLERAFEKKKRFIHSLMISCKKNIAAIPKSNKKREAYTSSLLTIGKFKKKKKSAPQK